MENAWFKISFNITKVRIGVGTVFVLRVKGRQKVDLKTHVIYRNPIFSVCKNCLT